MQVGVRLGVSGSLAVEDLVARNFVSAELNGRFSYFPDSLHMQRARECKGDCSKQVAPIS